MYTCPCSLGITVVLHGACEPVRRAQVGGALPVGDHRALGRRDDLSRSRGSLGGEDLRSIPVAAKAGGRRLLLRRTLPVGTFRNHPPAVCMAWRKDLRKRDSSANMSLAERHGGQTISLATPAWGVIPIGLRDHRIWNTNQK